ncbi:hypothetical protein COY26_05005 [Candidatus Woesearchaeota archaeon CG_4_10_14_0_2_um_filter_33_10]|nr:MAG: hypothetical protein COV14_00835 [Candidatus Woesearchaeota archaeon CG10_big_fil_rev_8_21_14_0_10_33_12]PIU72280.1 MAG: hypothetical protein COS79_03725 [Candidatus Woesearchaeota archaeon CG06_land_8_20_14_3_00_33_13]PIZ52239.1 MAG: hypothetical protein COY26_05005 [Candidatus Woesearchaeota archaeon CG_4_10_14_0_2_um_filter_33_10]
MKTKFIFLLLIFVILLANGCKECEINSDCNSKARELYSGYSTNCLDVACNVNNKCEINKISNCCGNKICETNAGESKCSCEKDCGKCSGKGEIKIGSRTYDTEYLEYGCKDNECALIIDESLIRGIDLTYDKEFNYFKIGITSSLDQPFNIGISKFNVKIQLEDTDKDLVLPVVITSLKLVEREVMIGEKEFDGTLNYISDSFIESIPINEDCMQNIEEDKSLSLVIGYTYIMKERTGYDSEGNPIYENKVKRDTYTKAYSSKLFFVNPEK